MSEEDTLDYLVELLNKSNSLRSIPNLMDSFDDDLSISDLSDSNSVIHDHNCKRPRLLGEDPEEDVKTIDLSSFDESKSESAQKMRELIETYSIGRYKLILPSDCCGPIECSYCKEAPCNVELRIVKAKGAAKQKTFLYHLGNDHMNCQRCKKGWGIQIRQGHRGDSIRVSLRRKSSHTHTV